MLNIACEHLGRDVERGAFAVSTERGVGPFAVGGVVGQDVGAVDGRALSTVDGHGVGVLDAVGDLVAVEQNMAGLVAVVFDAQPAIAGIGDGSAAAVDRAGQPVVLRRDDAIADGETTVTIGRVGPE